MKFCESMEESFQIPVMYKEEELFFTARLITHGYTHKFQVDVYGQELFFEQDDSGDYRALINFSDMEVEKKPDVELLKAIAASIESILK